MSFFFLYGLANLEILIFFCFPIFLKCLYVEMNIVNNRVAYNWILQATRPTKLWWQMRSCTTTANDWSRTSGWISTATSRTTQHTHGPDHYWRPYLRLAPGYTTTNGVSAHTDVLKYVYENVIYCCLSCSEAFPCIGIKLMGNSFHFLLEVRCLAQINTKELKIDLFV